MQIRLQFYSGAGEYFCEQERVKKNAKVNILLTVTVEEITLNILTIILINYLSIEYKEK